MNINHPLPASDRDVVIVEGLLGLPPRSAEQLGNQTVLKGDGYRVIVLSFPDGFVMREHQSPKTLLIQVLDGRFRLGVQGINHTASPGTLIRLNPNVPHDVEALDAGHLQLTVLET